LYHRGAAKKNWVLPAVLAILFAILLSSCGTAPDVEKSESKKPERVVALTGGLADLWLLAGGNLVGAVEDTFSEYGIPEDGITNIGGTHTFSLELILAINPDLVLASLDIPAHVKAEGVLAEAGIEVRNFKVESFPEYYETLGAFTELTGRPDLMAEYGDRVKEKIDGIVNGVSGVSPKVLLIRSSSAGVNARNSETMTGAMLKDLGVTNIADAGPLSDGLSIEEIIRQDPDFIFAVTMGDEEKAKEILNATLYEDPAWSSLSAVKGGRFIMLPKELFHLKPNKRWAESYLIMKEMLYGGQGA
jgi:iron complex transport system substrate-binding protein